ncbi:nicotinate-nucleotide--dimethylbenzimidazole phosphoribosyltransferase [candidate division MSBL1 archaeon SCGC-AAA259O05]|uniref:Nicotinate-nucleotide--dimethylbenzimidazole phosphoribosyltransferase n=1 Tax=candidate division MSBL1 archaeon SCGC-AAA259O05 TaxID=1698271 RepID=A0A133V5V5_9EURY|nr:nicotinate-nucleotide--dimethylbenzimidazole phosphoribosyltransferase [candidate division MSBL1 archaeon SCGC-AAA259O05]
MNLIQKIKNQIEKLDGESMEEARKRQNRLTKPKNSLGRLEELSIKIAGITSNPSPNVDKKGILTFAADHGVANEGVSAYLQEVTGQMIQNFVKGGAAINVLSEQAGAELLVIDIGSKADLEESEGLKIKKVGEGTGNILKEKAMSRENAEKSIKIGINSFKNTDPDLVGIGDMGIGNTTVSSAITATITGKPPKKVTGRGTGVDEETLKRKTKTVEKALDLRDPNPNDGIEILSKIGGYEIGGMTGVILSAAANRTPVLIDGFISTAAALIASTIEPKTKQYMIASHESGVKGHKHALEHLGLQPVLDLEMRLGEGTGSALAMPIIETSCKILNDMLTFEEAGVSTN